jgi:superfamily II DNA or RNA helicase
MPVMNSPRTWALDLQPRTWQSSALNIWQQNWRGVVSVVTGGGKTLFAEMCMLKFRAKFPNGRFLIIVPTSALLDQWFVSLTEDLKVPDSHIACYSGEDKPKRPNAVNLMVINTARDVAAQVARSTDTFIIVDECHRAGSPINARALLGNHQASLGLSATPQREYDDGFHTYIVPALGPVIYEYGYRDAFQDGVISPFELVNVEVEMLSDEQREFDSLTNRARRELGRINKIGGSDERLRRILQQRSAVSASAVMRIPVAAAIVEQNRGRRTLVFHERVDAATSLMQVLAKRKHSVTIYHSRISPVVRRDNLRLFRRGLFDVLISCRALDEGTNIPETTVAVVASSTASQRQRIQRLGRVLRPAPEKQFATVYTLYATKQERKRLEQEEAKLEGITSVSWQRGSIRENG